MGEYKSPSEAACTGGTSYDPVRCLPCTSSCSRGNYIAGRYFLSVFLLVACGQVLWSVWGF